MSTRPPCTADAAAQKARAAEDGWTSRAPGCVTLAHAGDSRRRNRAGFLSGHATIAHLLRRTSARELDHRLGTEASAFGGNRIAARFVHEGRDEGGSWFRGHGDETWQPDVKGADAGTSCRHQRPADPEGRGAVPLAGARATPGRAFRPDGARAVAA